MIAPAGRKRGFCLLVFSEAPPSPETLHIARGHTRAFVCTYTLLESYWPETAHEPTLWLRDCLKSVVGPS